MMLCISAYAASSNDNNRLCFGNVVYSSNTAKVTVTNNTTENKSATLIVLTYDSQGRVTDVKSDKVTNLQGGGNSATLTASFNSSATKVSTFVMEDLFSTENMPMPAVKGTNSTDLAYILVNGKMIDGFSNDVEKYIVENTSNFVLEAVAKDNSTAVTVTKDDELNIYEIHIKSHNGDLERIVTVAAYDDYKDTVAIDKLTYVTDTGVTGEVTDFSSEVVLPKFTKTVRVSAVSNYGQKIEYYVKNDTLTNPVEALEDNGIIASANSKAVYTYPRPAKDQTIPIKNESSTAVIYVTGINNYGREEVKEYKIKFTAQQPRITEFNYEHGYPYPVFVSGAALYNDAYIDPADETVALGGQPVIADRNQVCVDISPELEGASIIMFPQNAKDGGWYTENTSGEYFSFVADTGGTIYAFAQNGFKNSEYTSDKHGDGWVASDYTIVVKNGSSTWNKVYCRTFEKGETVKIYHFGRNGTSSNDYKGTYAILWEENIIASCEDLLLDIYALRDINEQLPSTVTVTLTSGAQTEFNVNWDTTAYDPNGPVIQTITGQLSGEYVLAEGASDTITATLYVSQTEDLSANLDKVIYVTDTGATGEITDFTEVIELPKYTKTVTIEGVSEYGEKIEYCVKNETLIAPGANGDWGILADENATGVFTAERPAKDGVIPLKNETASAVIYVTGTTPSGKENTKYYEIKFTAEQARITQFNYSHGEPYPVYVGGAALYNDALINSEDSTVAIAGSIVSSDRNQIATSIPEELIGASSILFPVNNKGGGWYEENTSGEYFSFVADNGGTIYVFSQNSFKNSEYTNDSHGEGWRSISGISIGLKNPTTNWNNGYYRTFEKGETVTIYHLGRNSTSSNDYKITCAIVWKENVIKSVADIEFNIDKSMDIESQLPETVKATILCGDEIDVEVTWDISGYDPNGDSVQTIYGTISGEYIFCEGVSNQVMATLNIVQNEIISVYAPETIYLKQGEALESILPSTVIAETSVGNEVECEVIWNTDSFDNTQVGIYILEGEITSPEGIPSNGIVANITVLVKYADEHIVFALEEAGMMKDSDKWIDLSSYGNDVDLNIDNNTMMWTDDGLYIEAGSENSVEIPAGTDNNIFDAIASQEFTIEFETSAINVSAGCELPFFTADINFTRNNSTQDGNMIINYNDSNARNYVKFGGGVSRYWALDSLDTVNTHKNVITVTTNSSNSSNRDVSWYVDGELRSTVTLSNNGTVNSLSRLYLMGNTPVSTNASVGGSIVWKSFKIYDCVIDVAETE